MDTPLIQSFAQKVEQELANTPYTVERTPAGFNVSLNLADAKWWMPLSRSGLKDTFVYEVTCNEEKRTYKINDVRRRLEWQGGVKAGTLKPYFNLDYNYHSGTIVGYRREIVIGATDQGEIKPVVDIDFSPAEKRKLIRDIAKSLGWKSTLSLNQKLGIGFAIGSAAIALLIIVSAIVIAALYI